MSLSVRVVAGGLKTNGQVENAILEIVEMLKNVFKMRWFTSRTSCSINTSNDLYFEHHRFVTVVSSNVLHVRCVISSYYLLFMLCHTWFVGFHGYFQSWSRIMLPVKLLMLF